jgi:hypothetical protein
MVKINFKTDKEVNFLMVLYQMIKKQNSFENLSFKGIFTLEKEDKIMIKNIIRNKANILEAIKQNQKLNPLYRDNKKTWEGYWNTNKHKLLEIKKLLEQKASKYDFFIFEKVGAFFNFKGPEEIDFYLCMGNEVEVGTGNAFSPNLAFMFPRNFKNPSEKSINADFAVLIHEVMHLYQDMCSEEDKELREAIAKCFAPRGILINEDKFNGNLGFYDKIKKSFQKKETYKDIREDLYSLMHNTPLGDKQLNCGEVKNEKKSNFTRIVSKV